MKRRTLLKAAAASALLPAPAIGQGNAKVLLCAPEANLASIDPVWTTATVAVNYGYMVYDTLYGSDVGLVPRPQMAEGHTLSDDKLLYTFKLRAGLAFHDGEPVRSRDCIASINRWSKRSAWGQALGARIEEMKVVDDRSFTMRLKMPFALTLNALGQGHSFIMPERVALTDPFKQITETVGSGPFMFKRDEWIAGAKAVWVKNTKYVPRDEEPNMLSGGKRVFVDRVEQIVMPDGATAAAALQSGEIDWVQVPTIDLIPMLKKSRGVRTFVNDPFGWVGVIRPNFLHPPFNNPKLLRAILPAVDQKEFLAAVIGDQQELGKEPVGIFALGTPMANTAGLEVLSGPRDLALAKRLVAESGYKGEKVVLMSPTDQPALTQISQVTRELFMKLGLNVEYQSMDWSTLVSRRASREPPDKGGWNAFCTAWDGMSVSDPGGHFPIRGNGRGAWFGWPDDPKMEALRDAWFNAPDLAAQKKLAEEIQIHAMQEVPIIPTGQWFTPNATRDNIHDIVRSALALHWNVKKG
ncbi:MAG: ABC transporter substrate-binding protein [Acetobacteraceae bacterium]|nr:ABC transporter substrate-binding protein [Acetobacteraceae bacterium]